LSLLDIYILNLALTLAMFIVLIFRAWVEFKHYKMMWKELDWRRTREALAKILPSERELFTRTSDGKELYELLCRIFEIREKK